MLKKLATGLFGAFAVLVCLGQSFVVDAHADVIAAPMVCKSFLSNGYGMPRILKIRARRSARKAWVKRVRNAPALGAQWAKWSLAKNRSMKCARTGIRWRCRASARACRVI